LWQAVCQLRITGTGQVNLLRLPAPQEPGKEGVRRTTHHRVHFVTVTLGHLHCGAVLDDAPLPASIRGLQEPASSVSQGRFVPTRRYTANDGCKCTLDEALRPIRRLVAESEVNMMDLDLPPPRPNPPPRRTCRSQGERWPIPGIVRHRRPRGDKRRLRLLQVGNHFSCHPAPASAYFLVALLRPARVLRDEFVLDHALHHASIGISIPRQMCHELGPRPIG